MARARVKKLGGYHSNGIDVHSEEFMDIVAEAQDEGYDVIQYHDGSSIRYYALTQEGEEFAGARGYY